MVSSMSLRSEAARFLLIVLTALFFSGCGTQQPDQSQAYFADSARADAGFYLRRMEQSSDNNKTNWQLLAIGALLREGNSQQAEELFNQLPAKLTDAQRREQSLLATEVKLAREDFPAARRLLEKLSRDGLDNKQQARYWQAWIGASQGRPSLSLLRAFIARQPLLSAPERQKNIDATWQILSEMTPEQARALVINADENILQGWLDLQRVWLDNRHDPQMLQAGIADWQQRYPHNPGAAMLPTQLTGVQGFKSAGTEKIALMLPLNGQAAVFGRMILQGFEAAKNTAIAPVTDINIQPAEPVIDDMDSPPQAPLSDVTAAEHDSVSGPEASSAAVYSAPADPDAEVIIYDTSSQPLDQLLAQAQQDGVSILVGPLLKSNVEALAKSNTALDALALNQPEQPQNHGNICWFALSPEDEARDAARYIALQGKKAPLLLSGRGTLGDRVVSAFAQEWRQLGGGIVRRQKFGSIAELKMNINGGAGIALTGSPVRDSLPPSQGATIGGLTIPAPPTEEQITDSAVDAVYILASAEEIAFIKPMIAMRSGSQSDVALYASSRSAQGSLGADFRLEMEGLQYSEIPMLAGGNPALMRQALSSAGNDYSLARLYAMGVDAWSLVRHFAQLRQPGFTIQGNTGVLSVSRDCVINRKLSWLKYQQGQIVPAI